MEVRRITIEELKKMTDSEGVILQGCGGDLQEWINETNGALTGEGILLEGTGISLIVAKVLQNIIQEIILTKILSSSRDLNILLRTDVFLLSVAMKFLCNASASFLNTFRHFCPLGDSTLQSSSEKVTSNCQCRLSIFQCSRTISNNLSGGASKLLI